MVGGFSRMGGGVLPICAADRLAGSGAPHSRVCEWPPAASGRGSRSPHQQRQCCSDCTAPPSYCHRHAGAGAGNREGAEQAPTNDEVHSRRCRVRRQQRVLVKSNVREGCIRAGQRRVKQREQGRGGEMQSLLAGSHHENHPLPAQVAVHARHCCSCLSLCLPPVGCCMLLPGWVSAHR